MKNQFAWKATKYVFTKNGWKASRDTKEVCKASRLMADIQGRAYEKALCKYAKGLLLDVGCGKTPLYGIYKEYVKENVCVDWANTSHKSPYLDYECDLNRELPLENKYFDTILASDVLEHIANPDMFWHEISRVLKTNGKLILGVPFLYPIHEAPHDYCRYTAYKLQMFCEHNGLKLLHLETFGGQKEVILNLLQKRFAGSILLGTLISILVKLVLMTNKRKKPPPASEENWPLGYLLVAERL